MFTARGGAIAAGTAVRCLASLVAAAIAAVAAHDAIDRLGDVLLAHDTYDGVVHASRASVLVVAAILGATMLAAALRHAVMAGRERATLAAFRDAAVRGSYIGTVVTVALLTVGLTASMEWYDALVQGQRVAGFDDLLGGSLALGMATSLGFGAFAGALAWALRRAVAASHRAVAGVVAAFVRRLASLGDAPFTARRRRIRRTAHASLLAIRTGKRGPPTLSFVAFTR